MIPEFDSPFFSDSRLSLIRQMVNTLLASGVANEKNGYLKLSEDQVDLVRASVKGSDRFNADEEQALQNLIDAAISSNSGLIGVGGTFSKEAKMVDVINFYTGVIKKPLHLDSEKLEPINLSF